MLALQLPSPPLTLLCAPPLGAPFPPPPPRLLQATWRATSIIPVTPTSSCTRCCALETAACATASPWWPARECRGCGGVRVVQLCRSCSVEAAAALAPCYRLSSITLVVGHLPRPTPPRLSAGTSPAALSCATTTTTSSAACPARSCLAGAAPGSAGGALCDPPVRSRLLSLAAFQRHVVSLMTAQPFLNPPYSPPAQPFACGIRLL